MPEGYIVLAAELGFEPRQTVSETGVLPLHNSAMRFFNSRIIAKPFPKINTEIYSFTGSNGGIAPISVNLSLTLPISS